MVKPRGYWTYERCKEEAIKYKNITELENNCISAYNTIIRNNWRTSLCGHMQTINIWNYENCKKEALKYNTRSELEKNVGGAYNSIRRNNWWELLDHMAIIGSRKKRMIYAYEFSDNHVYIGLTFNINKRNTAHFNDINSSVNKHFLKTNIIPKLVKISDYIDVVDACKLEEKTKDIYFKNGWYILNKIKTGGIGGINLIYSFDKCKIEAIKYNSREELKEKNISVYNAIHKNKWYDLLNHMNRKYKQKGYWTYESCKIEAMKYINSKTFRKESYYAYQFSWKHKWLNKFFPKSI